MTGSTRYSCSCFLTVVLLAVAFAAGTFEARAAEPTFERVQAFTRGPDTPEAKLLRVADGSFYGTTSAGGADDKGTIFRILPSGTYSVVLSFTGGNGAKPKAGLITDPEGNFYGTTSAGGTNDSGTIFKLKPDGTLITLHSFYMYGEPTTPLARDAEGNLYGTSEDTVFKLTPAGEFQRLVYFDNTNGGLSAGGVIFGPDGNLYGTTKGGVVYRLTPTGQFTTVVTFPTPGLSVPQSGLIFGPDGNLYGTTYNTVYKVTPAGIYSLLGTFNTTNGDLACAELALGPDGYFYGTTYAGGLQKYGAIYKVAPEGGISLVASLNYTLSGRPVAALEPGADGNLYGTASLGGRGGAGGGVFRVTPQGYLNIITNFSEVVNRTPGGPLISAGDGSFYGLTGEGGAYARGTCFRVTTEGELSVTAIFTSATGLNPLGPLARGVDGNYYGVTKEHGSAGYGTIFKITPAGTLTVIHHFSPQSAGWDPQGGLVSGADGNFYGTCAGGGSYGYGTVFRVTPSGVHTILVHFDNPNGRSPVSALVAGSDGYLYGSTSRGGTFDNGTFFKVDTAGTLTTLVSVPANGGKYGANLSEDPDGNFYGTFRYGRSSAFKMTPSGMLTELYKFDASLGASNPAGGLIRGPDGNFYGTTHSGNGGGGPSGAGTLFRLTPAGALTTLVNFNGPDGRHPQGLLVAGPDGNLYGTTLAGGTTSTGQAGDGQVFRLRFGPTPVTQPATLVQSSSVTLGGTVDPHGGLTQVSFQYGTSPTLATFTTVNVATLPANEGSIPIALPLAGVSPQTTYYFRIVASNPANPVPQTGTILRFTTSAPTAFDLWHLAEGATGGTSGDPDKDGLTNLLEYAFGTDPTLAASHVTWEESGLLVSRGLPTLRTQAPSPSVGLYSRRLDRASSGLTYTPQFSSDLEVWHDDITPPSILAADGEVEILSVAFPILPDGRPAKFFRLHVALP